MYTGQETLCNENQMGLFMDLSIETSLHPTSKMPNRTRSNVTLKPNDSHISSIWKIGLKSSVHHVPTITLECN